MRDVVAVGPRDRGARFDGNDRVLEGEIADLYGGSNRRRSRFAHHRNRRHHQRSGDERSGLKRERFERTAHKISFGQAERVESISAMRSWPRTNIASVIPSMPWSCSAGTLRG